MYLKNDRIIVRAGGLVFKSHSANNVSHFRLDPTAVQGWTDGVDVRRDASVRPTSWGDFSESGRLSSRLITISGTAIAQSPGELQVMRDAFIGSFADGEYSEMSLETSVDVRYATVTLGNRPVWVQQLDTVAIWKLDLYAPDPRVYSVARRTSVTDALASINGRSYPVTYPMDYGLPPGAITSPSVTNIGNVESYPQFVVTGTYSGGFSISNGKDRRVTFSGDTTMASPVTIDMRKGTIVQNGVDKSTLLLERNWFSVAPGETILPQFSSVNPGSGWCDIIFRSTWI